jgi:hypothetical protein
VLAALLCGGACEGERHDSADTRPILAADASLEEVAASMEFWLDRDPHGVSLRATGLSRHFTGEGLRRLLSHPGLAVVTDVSLAHLSLGQTEAGWLRDSAHDATVSLLAASPRLRPRWLFFSSGGFGAEGTEALANGSLLERTEWLAIDNAPIGDAGALALANGPRVIRLAHLNLHRVGLGPEGARALLQSRVLGGLFVLGLTGDELPWPELFPLLLDETLLPRLLKVEFCGPLPDAELLARIHEVRPGLDFVIMSSCDPDAPLPPELENLLSPLLGSPGALEPAER